MVRGGYGGRQRSRYLRSPLFQRFPPGVLRYFGQIVCLGVSTPLAVEPPMVTLAFLPSQFLHTSSVSMAKVIRRRRKINKHKKDNNNTQHEALCSDLKVGL